MKSSDEFTRLYLTYQNGFVIADIEHDEKKTPYDGYFKNDRGLDPHTYCARLADEIEAELNVPVKWSMKEVLDEDKHSARIFNNVLERNYEYLFSNDKEPSTTAQIYNASITERIDGINERKKAFPNEYQLLQESLSLNREAETIWCVCEKRLRVLYGESSNEQRKIEIAKEINIAHENVEKYNTAVVIVIAEISRNSKLYKFGEALSNAGQSMQGAGNAMQSVGNSMTVGCTIPAILIALLILLFIFLL